MQFLHLLLTLLLSLATSTHATPLTETSAALAVLHARLDATADKPKGVYMCRNANFDPAGGCKYIHLALPIPPLRPTLYLPCHSWLCGSDKGHDCAITAEDLADTWLSFGPDEGVVCRLTTADKCSEKLYADDITFPGTGDVRGWGALQRHNSQGGIGTEPTYLGFRCWLG